MGRQGGIVPYDGGHSLISLVPTCLPPPKKKIKKKSQRKKKEKNTKETNAFYAVLRVTPSFTFTRGNNP